MPKVVVVRNVVDVDTWLKGKPERHAAITAMGGSNIVDYVAADASNSAAVSLEIDDVDALLAVAANPPPETAALMERHGVILPNRVYIAK